jgi:hypothetical protein
MRPRVIDLHQHGVIDLIGESGLNGDQIRAMSIAG